MHDKIKNFVSRFIHIKLKVNTYLCKVAILFRYRSTISYPLPSKDVSYLFLAEDVVLSLLIICLYFVCFNVSQERALKAVIIRSLAFLYFYKPIN